LEVISLCKILIAEDEAWISSLICSIIQKGCPNVQIAGEAANGREALKAINTLRPDIVLADINMPILNGLQLIEESKKAGFTSKFIIITGYKDFAYVQQALRNGVEDYLLKPINDDKLCAVIDQVARKIQNEANLTRQNSLNDALLKAQFLSRLLVGERPSMSACNESFGLSFAPGQYRCAVLKFVHRNLDHSYLITDCLTEITEYFRRNLQDLLAPLCSEDFVIQQGSFLILFLNYPLEHMRSVQQALNKLFDQLLSDCAARSIQVTMGLSDVCMDFSLLPEIYRQAQHAVAARLSVGAGKIIPFKPDGRNRNANLSALTLSKQDLLALNRALHSSSADDLVGWFNRLFDDYIRKNNIIETETLLMLDVSTTLLTAFLDIVNMLPFQHPLDRSTLLHQLNAYPTVQELRIHVDTLLRDSKARIDQQRNVTDMTINRITKYIDTHLSDSITLEEVAQAVYLTPNYLSEYFKNKTGTNFKNYVLQRRMDRATNLLRRSNCRIQEIASQCGYTDFKHFCKVFKKSIGVTPTEFRRIYG